MDELTPAMLESTTPIDNQATAIQEVEGSTQNQGSEQPPTQEVKPEKQIYNNDELVQLLESDGTVDTERLSEEGKVLMKSFQRGYTKKFENLAEERRKIDEERQRIINENKTYQEQQLQKSNPREFLYQQYLRNPNKIVSDIYAQIAELERDPYNEENRSQIVRLQAMKDEFNIRRQQDFERNKNSEYAYSKAQSELITAIPNFQEKSPKLAEFAMSLGLSQQDIETISNPAITGDFAIKITKAINKAFDIVNAGKMAEQKLNKAAPEILGRPGSGSNYQNKGKDLSTMSYAEYKKHREKGE